MALAFIFASGKSRKHLSDFGGGLNWSTQHFIFLVKDGVLVMCQRYRRGFTAAEKTELWDHWQRGESLKAIGRAFSKPSSSIYCPRNLDASSDSCWYDFEADYPAVVSNRDRQLQELLTWLRQKDPMGKIGIKRDEA
jgi:hypothetical protein